MLFLNGIVGYQLLDDGTPLSLGLILLSAIALFVGTGYIALDTGFEYTGHFDASPNNPNNRNIGLYVLYQLAPLVFLAGFFVLETRTESIRREKANALVLRLCNCCQSSLTLYSLSLVCGFAIRHRSNIPICHQHPHMPLDKYSNQRCNVRNAIHPLLRHHDMGFLVKHHRG